MFPAQSDKRGSSTSTCENKSTPSKNTTSQTTTTKKKRTKKLFLFKRKTTNQQNNDQLHHHDGEGTGIMLLPTEILVYIFGFLLPSTLATMSLTNTFFLELTQSDNLWKPIAFSLFPSSPWEPFFAVLCSSL